MLASGPRGYGYDWGAGPHVSFGQGEASIGGVVPSWARPFVPGSLTMDYNNPAAIQELNHLMNTTVCVAVAQNMAGNGH
jgi:hypothetical protein